MAISRRTYSPKEKAFLRNIGFKIQFLRKKAGMSQMELAERSGLSYATISHAESTEVYGLSVIAIYRLAAALGVTPDQIFRHD